MCLLRAFIITPNLVRSTDAKSVQELYLDFSNKEAFFLGLWNCKTTIWLVMKTPNESDPLFIASPYYSGHWLCWGNHSFNHYKNDFKSSLCGHGWVQGSKGDTHLFFSWHVSWTSAVNMTILFLNFAPTGHKNVNIPIRQKMLGTCLTEAQGKCLGQHKPGVVFMFFQYTNCSAPGLITESPLYAFDAWLTRRLGRRPRLVHPVTVTSLNRPSAALNSFQHFTSLSL